jgi:alpha-beta hydrolase superfamily lysophospholipase
MKLKIARLIHRVLRAIISGAIGATVVLVVVFVMYLNNQPDLQVWHLADLDEEFTQHSKVESFAEYLALEARLFKQLDSQVYAKIKPEQQRQLNRYSQGSMSDPQHWSPNWNHSFELPASSPAAGVLLLHGMSDSPYSVHHLGETLHDAGAYVLGLRLPGHGTAPSALVNISWQDMAAAVRLAMRHLAEQSDGRPLYIVGYSTGAALAVHYAIATVKDEDLPKVQRLVVLSPAIGVTSVAVLAIWQARLGRLLGLQKLAWNVILPEYDPFKYGSFAVNAGNVVYRLANEIQQGLTELAESGSLEKVPPILAFSSIVDATVSTPRLVRGLFERLPNGGHELVLFDINRMAEIEPMLKWSPAQVIRDLQVKPHPTFTLSLVINKSADEREVMVRSHRPGQENPVDSSLGSLAWPEDLYSLAHVALPFPADDTLYGGNPKGESPSGLGIGSIAMRGERGVLHISASDMLRLRWNPFYPYIEERMLDFLELGGR